MKTLRDYQKWCIYGGGPGGPGILPTFEKVNSALCVLPTGTGKTTVFSRVAAEWTKGNVLCIAHRIELVDQMAESIAAEIGYTPAVEQGERGMDPDNLWEGGFIVCGSVQSMISKRRLQKFSRSPFGLIITDEAHRATAASYVHLIDHYRKMYEGLKHLGVTATPNRTDGTATGLTYEEVAYHLPMTEAIDNGWLVDIHQKFCMLGKVDFSGLQVARNEFGEVDFKQADLEHVLKEESQLHAMSQAVLDVTANGEQAIIFAASVAHAHLWAMVLNRYRKGSAEAVDGETLREDRDQHVKAFRRGELQFLLGYDVFTEGFDAPTCSLVVMGRPTKSVLKYTQMLGRGTRPLPGIVDGPPTIAGRKDAIAASRKPWVTVLDFVGNSKHKIITATDILGGNYDIDIRDKANKLLGAKPGNTRDAITKARASMILLAEEKRRENVKGTATYEIHDVDPFGATPVDQEIDVARGGATDGQVGFLVNLGVDKNIALGYSKGQAGAVITKLKAKRCTVRQAMVLKKYGLEPADFNVDSASKKISELLGRDKGEES